MTSGRWTNTLSSERPQNRPRASSIATASATGRLPSIAQAPTRSDSLIAVSSSGVKPPIMKILGTSMRRAEHGETVTVELSGRIGAAQIGGESGRVGVLRRRDEAGRVDDRRMAVGREGADDLDLGLDRGVGLVDDAVGRLAARHQQQAGAHILGGGEAPYG